MKPKPSLIWHHGGQNVLQGRVADEFRSRFTALGACTCVK